MGVVRQRRRERGSGPPPGKSACRRDDVGTHRRLIVLAGISWPTAFAGVKSIPRLESVFPEGLLLGMFGWHIPIVDLLNDKARKKADRGDLSPDEICKRTIFGR